MLITSIGQRHVHSPCRVKIPVFGYNNETYADLKVFRFFVDGLIIYTGRKLSDKNLLKFWGNRVIGASNQLMVLGRKFEGSRQEAMLNFFQDEMSEKFPENAARIYQYLNNEKLRNAP